ncbi:MAG: helix-turn-helix transcriptional regulator [Bacteroidales bacterium]|nr:helix-turn-helix transcriptional regulator [Bacteroidales bacterium]
MANLILIRQLCKEKGIAFKELARRVNKKESSLQSIIKNGSTTVRTLEDISRELGVSPAVFFEPVITPDKQLQLEMTNLKEQLDKQQKMIEQLIDREKE